MMIFTFVVTLATAMLFLGGFRIGVALSKRRRNSRKKKVTYDYTGANQSWTIGAGGIAAPTLSGGGGSSWFNTTTMTATFYAPKALDEPEATPLQTRSQDTPIEAWKQSFLIFNRGSYYFQGLHWGGSFGAVAKAECSLGGGYPRDHLAPLPSCSCGFYASNDPLLLDADSSYLLDVSLYGTVIVHENGYRAEHQKVTKVHVSKRCYVCPEPAFALGLDDASFSKSPVCSVLPICEAHKQSFNVSLNDVSRLMGVSFSWAEKGE